MSAGVSTYEEVRAFVEDLAQSDGDRRLVRWVGSDRVAGAARAPGGRLEIFVAGPCLGVEDARVREAVSHGTWDGEFGPVVANQVQLPKGEHYQRVAAFLLVELLQLGVEDDPRRAFRAIEPILALLFEEAELRQSWLFGLAGEMLCLNTLLDEAAPGEADRVLGSWKGSGRSARDIQLGEAGIEVKTTSGTTSRHKIQGFHQIEPGASVGDVIESSLFLWSIGLRWQDGGEGYSIDGLISRIAERAVSPEVRTEFLENSARYRSAGSGHASPEDGSTRAFQRPVHVVFARLYDLGDPAFAPLRRSDLEGRAHTPADSVSFDVDLPAELTYQSNPVSTLRDGARHALTRAGITLRVD